ncbi:DUF6297 family protein [Propionibacterium sp.]|uniref:DUF6297 family protein n=1 Tax=Propionibacterium sp. TaxID=1977903 RepID=UPI0039E93B32
MSRKKNRRRSTPKATSPRPGRQDGQHSGPVQPEAPAALEVVHEYDFVDVGFDGQGRVDERQLMLLVKDWRKGRATRTLWDVLTDGYVALFSVVVIAAMVISAIRTAQHQASGCSTEGCGTARELLPWLVMAGMWAAALAASRIFGPVVASAAEGFWLLDAPLRRSKILAKRLWMMVIGAGLLGAAVAVLVTALTGLDTPSVVAWTCAIGITAAGWVAFAAAEQGAERTVLVRAAQIVVGALAVVVLLAVIGTASGWFGLGIASGQTMSFAMAVGVIGLVLCVLAALIAWRRLDQVGRSQLVNGGELVSGMQGAAFALDFALMRDILVERRNQQRGQVTPKRGRGLGTRALVWRDVQRLGRNPAPLVTLAVSVVVPYALVSLGLVALAPSISALVMVAVMVPFMDSMRVLSRTKGLARLFPVTDAQLRSAATVVPVVLAAIWAILVSPAFVFPLAGRNAGTIEPNHLLYGVLTAAAGLLGAIRWVTAKSANYNAPMVATGAGAVPPGLMFNLVRGIDIVVVVTFPLVMGWTPLVSMAIALIAWMLLRSGGINQQEMLEASEESRKELAKMREEKRNGTAGGGRTKQVITRSGSGQPRRRPPLRTK